MRSAAERLRRDPRVVEPLVPVALVVDHSVQVDEWNTPDALRMNMEIEFRRNRPRYEFLKWGMQAFQGFSVVPPGIGIVHQVNLEYLAPGVHSSDGVYYPDSLVGTDSHTTMINGLGIVGWGVGGIEAEAGMLGQPVYFLTPDVVGVHLPRPALRRRHGDRPRSRRHRDAPEGPGGRQVRRVFRRGRRVAPRHRPRDGGQHGARVRRDDGLLPDRREILRLPSRDRPFRRARRDVSRLLRGPGPLRNSAPRRVRLHRDARARPRARCGRASRGRSGRRTASTCRT